MVNSLGSTIECRSSHVYAASQTGHEKGTRGDTESVFLWVSSALTRQQHDRELYS